MIACAVRGAHPADRVDLDENNVRAMRPWWPVSSTRATLVASLMRCKQGFEEFTLSLHPEKTRLIEFGRFAASDRKKRGVGKPETFGSWASRSSAENRARATSSSTKDPT